MLQEYVSIHPIWFNKLVLINNTELDEMFAKIDINKLNQKLEENM